MLIDLYILYMHVDILNFYKSFFISMKDSAMSYPDSMVKVSQQ